uniref:Uncharacterized protein n=1 Tax=Arundo donax TaxID=35708 RepID=A0A0A9AUA4_ARUDO
MMAGVSTTPATAAVPVLDKADCTA